MKRSQTSSRKTASSSGTTAARTSGRRGTKKAGAGGRRSSENAQAEGGQKDVKMTSQARSLESPPQRGRGKQVIPEDRCISCDADLKQADRALFVEEEVGRVFCSEACITQYFQPDIERLEKEYLRLRGTHDLNAEQREKLAHLRWVTLEAPDEGWCERTLAGDLRYTFISEFQPEDKPLWMVCICLMLRGEPSFLFLAIPTKNRALVQHFRRGEALADEQLQKMAEEAAERASKAADSGALSEGGMSSEGGAGSVARVSDTLAHEGWSKEETARAGSAQGRSPGDIPESDFSKFEKCIEETLATPDEVWASALDEDSGSSGLEEGEEGLKLYHFIRRFTGQKISGGDGFWYVVVAKDTEDDSQIELLDSFPTRDPELVARYRKDELEYGAEPPNQASRMVH